MFASDGLDDMWTTALVYLRHFSNIIRHINFNLYKTGEKAVSQSFFDSRLRI